MIQSPLDKTYQALYDLCMAALNPTYAPGPDLLNPAVPAIPIIQDQQDQSSPTAGRYMAIGCPETTPYGTPDSEIGAAGAHTLTFDYTCTAPLWEVNGDGAGIETVRQFAWTDTGQAILEAHNVAILDDGPCIEMPRDIEHQWIRQHRAEFTFSIILQTTETLLPAAEIRWANADNPGIHGSVEYP